MSRSLGSSSAPPPPQPPPMGSDGLAYILAEAPPKRRKRKPKTVKSPAQRLLDRLELGNRSIASLVFETGLSFTQVSQALEEMEAGDQISITGEPGYERVALIAQRATLDETDGAADSSEE